MNTIRSFKTASATAAAVVLTLAVAVGINLAMFGLIDRALLSPPAHVVDPERVFTLAFGAPGDNNRQPAMATTSYLAFDSIRAQVSSAVDVAAVQRMSTGTVIDGAQVRTQVMLVSGSYFRLLGTRALFGRAILPEDDDAPAGSAPIVLSHTFWMSAFGGDRSVLGRRVVFRSVEFVVAGVMPAGFSGHTSENVDVWVPFRAAMQDTPGWDRNPFQNFASIIMRLPNVEAAGAAATEAGAAIERRVALAAIVGANISATERRIAYWLAGVSVLVLMIGLANSATLLLVRGSRRRRDLSIRIAIGATRSKLLQQIFIESAALAIVAVGAALALAYWFDEAVRQVLLPSITERSGLSPRLLGAAAAAGVLAFIVSVIVSAVQLPASYTAETAEAVTASRGRQRRKSHAALLVVQAALSVVLLSGAAMFARSLHNLGAQDFGMKLDGVLLVEFDRGPGIPSQRDVLESSVDRLRSLPGVELATPIQILPFTGFHVPPISVPGLAEPPRVNGQLPYLIASTPELLEILGIQIIEGRPFVKSDAQGALVVIVNESMARNTWPGQRALGKCIRIGFDPDFDPFTASGPPRPSAAVPCREVIGVAKNVRQRSVMPTGVEAQLMQYFVPFTQVPPPPGATGAAPGIQGILLRANAGPDALADPIRRIVVAGRTNLPFLHVRRYAELLEQQMRPWRQGTLLLSLFGALALGVAAIGMYAAFAHSVGERKREMAIRIAVGAEPGGVLEMILREAAMLAAIGVLLGCMATISAGRWLQSMLFETAPSDPFVLGLSGILMLIVAALATWIPARTASRSAPNDLLRVE
jgi:predicted permease